LLQFPPLFAISRAYKDYLVACAARAAPDRVCVEFRNHTWMTEANRAETLGFLTAHQLPYVCVDMPQGYPSSIPPVLAATAPLAVVRFHDHSDKWDSHNIYERFGYRYSSEELTGWAPKIRQLARQAEATHALFNNCYRDYAQTNAQQLATCSARTPSTWLTRILVSSARLTPGIRPSPILGAKWERRDVASCGQMRSAAVSVTVLITADVGERPRAGVSLA
jgi:uncharacterized protein YecE (DUF72 family)